jgi:DNA polymerase-3 subunit gamma/tau
MGAAALSPQRESAPSLNPDPGPVAAPAVAVEATAPEASAIKVESISSSPASEPQIDRLREAVLHALANGNQHFLVSMLSGGEWCVRGNELVIQLSESQTVVDMSVSNDAKRLAIASASGVLGRAVKFKVVGGANVAPQENKRNGATQTLPGVGGRARAEQDPVVQRMRDKFGAEIRTVIDYRDKR